MSEFVITSSHFETAGFAIFPSEYYVAGVVHQMVIVANNSNLSLIYCWNCY